MTTNLRLVLRTYSALRQMSPDDIALLETLRALNEGDRELMVETLQGKAAAKKAGKKSSTSKSSQSSSKSPRASGMATVLKSRVSQQREIARDDSQHCIAQIDDNGGLMECGKPVDDNVHHVRSIDDYHPFQSSSDAPPAPAPSPANGRVGDESASAASGD